MKQHSLSFNNNNNDDDDEDNNNNNNNNNNFFLSLPEIILKRILNQLSTGTLYRIRTVSCQWYRLISTLTPHRTNLSLLTFVNENRYMNFNLSHGEANFYGITHFDAVIWCTKWYEDDKFIGGSQSNNHEYETNDEENLSHLHLPRQQQKSPLIIQRGRGYDHLDENTCKELVMLFPHISTFTLVDPNKLCSVQAEKNVARMLYSWRNTLTTLTIVGHFDLNVIFRSLSSIRHLKSLTINAYLNQLAPILYRPTNPIRELYCWGLDPRQPISSDLPKLFGTVLSWKFFSYPTNVDCCYDYHYLNVWQEVITHNDPTLLTRNDFGYVSLRQLDRFSTMFTSLTSLSLRFWNRKLETVFCYLQRLSALRELTFEVENFDSFCHHFRYLPSLESVQIARLLFSIKPHHGHYLNTIFPNASLITFRVKSFSFYHKLLCYKTTYSKQYNKKKTSAENSTSATSKSNKFYYQICEICQFIDQTMAKYNLFEDHLHFVVKDDGRIDSYQVERFGFDWILDLVHN